MSDHWPYTLEYLVKAMIHAHDAKKALSSIDWERTLEDYEEEIFKSRERIILGEILLASENIIKARLALSDAMWNVVE